jgi:predicted  nucleic acid-binding Zn-ribbon protein
MGKQETKAPAPAPAKAEKKRTVLTDEERVAKLEAELKAAREKAEAKKNKARTVAMEKRGKLVAKRDELTKQIDAIDAEFPPATEVPAQDENAA